MANLADMTKNQILALIPHGIVTDTDLTRIIALGRKARRIVGRRQQAEAIQRDLAAQQEQAMARLREIDEAGKDDVIGPDD